MGVAAVTLEHESETPPGGLKSSVIESSLRTTSPNTVEHLTTANQSIVEPGCAELDSGGCNRLPPRRLRRCRGYGHTCGPSCQSGKRGSSNACKLSAAMAAGGASGTRAFGSHGTGGVGGALRKAAITPPYPSPSKGREPEAEGAKRKPKGRGPEGIERCWRLAPLAISHKTSGLKRHWRIQWHPCIEFERHWREQGGSRASETLVRD